MNIDQTSTMNIDTATPDITKIFSKYGNREAEYLFNPVLSDIKIKVIHEDKETSSSMELLIPAHKIMLCNNSKYFKTIICNWKKDDQNPIIDLTSISSDIVAVVINYLYSNNSLPIYVFSKPDIINSLIKIDDFFMFKKPIVSYFKSISADTYTINLEDFAEWYEASLVVPNIKTKLGEAFRSANLSSLPDIDFTDAQMQYVIKSFGRTEYRAILAFNWIIKNGRLSPKQLSFISFKYIDEADFNKYLKDRMEQLIKKDKNLASLIAVLFRKNDTIFNMICAMIDRA